MSQIQLPEHEQAKAPITEQAPVITIDGPSGAGKGTLCLRLAEKTGWQLLDSGALYRLTALAALQQSLDLADAQGLAALALALPVHFETQAAGVHAYLAGVPVGDAIRNESVAAVASKVASMPEVRQALLARQRAFARPPGLIADGRDMGTVVFPSAPLKIYLTASSSERARRRQVQLQAQGQDADYEAILAAVEARDHQDANRSTAPMRPAEDALVLDSSSLSIDEVVDRVWQQICLKKLYSPG